MPSRKKKPCVSIFTDASVYPDGRAGWGVFIMSDGGKVKTGGPIKQPCRSSLIAELRAIGNGMHVAESYELFKNKPLVIIQSDNTGALGMVLGSNDSYRWTPSRHRADVRVVPTTPHDDEHRQVLKYISGLHEKYAFVLMVRHVRGHNGRRGEGRHRLNEAADRLAKQGALL